MSIYERDNMRQRPTGKLRRISSRSPGDPTPRQLLVAVGQMLVTFLAVFLSLRAPSPPFIKVLIAGVFLVIGARWIMRSYHRG
jgi:hypothetical protein